MTVQDLSDSGAIDLFQVPDESLRTTPHMESISISVNGIVKLLKDLNPHKVAGSDQIKPLVLKRVEDTIASVLQVFFQRSLDTDWVPKDYSTAFVCPFFKKETPALLPSIGLFH